MLLHNTFEAHSFAITCSIWISIIFFMTVWTECFHEGMTDKNTAWMIRGLEFTTMMSVIGRLTFYMVNTPIPCCFAAGALLYGFYFSKALLYIYFFRRIDRAFSKLASLKISSLFRRAFWVFLILYFIVFGSIPPYQVIAYMLSPKKILHPSGSCWLYLSVSKFHQVLQFWLTVVGTGVDLLFQISLNAVFVQKLKALVSSRDVDGDIYQLVLKVVVLVSWTSLSSVIVTGLSWTVFQGAIVLETDATINLICVFLTFKCNSKFYHVFCGMFHNSCVCCIGAPEERRLVRMVKAPSETKSEKN